MATRSYPGLNPNVFQSWDYFSEIAILGLGNLGGEKSFGLLVDVLSESPAHQGRHEAACKALAKMQDPKAIAILHKKIVDPKFHASLAAYKALILLGDKQAEEVVHERLSLGLENEDSLLREVL